MRSRSPAWKLTEGQEYQDFIDDVLCKRGLLIRNYTSRKYQLTKGENLIGLEIKYDTQISTYGKARIQNDEHGLF